MGRMRHDVGPALLRILRDVDAKRCGEKEFLTRLSSQLPALRIIDGHELLLQGNEPCAKTSSAHRTGVNTATDEKRWIWLLQRQRTNEDRSTVHFDALTGK